MDKELELYYAWYNCTDDSKQLELFRAWRNYSAEVTNGLD